MWERGKNHDVRGAVEKWSVIKGGVPGRMDLGVAVRQPKTVGLHTQFGPQPVKGRLDFQQGGQGSNRNPERKDSFLLVFCF